MALPRLHKRVQPRVDKLLVGAKPALRGTLMGGPEYGDHELCDLICLLVKALAREPDAVEARVTRVADGRCLYVTVAFTDLGRVIGKQGRTAMALRVFLSAIGKKRGEAFRLDITAPPPNAAEKVLAD